MYRTTFLYKTLLVVYRALPGSTTGALAVEDHWIGHQELSIFVGEVSDVRTQPRGIFDHENVQEDVQDSEDGEADRVDQYHPNDAADDLGDQVRYVDVYERLVERLCSIVPAQWERN